MSVTHVFTKVYLGIHSDLFNNFSITLYYTFCSLINFNVISLTYMYIVLVAHNFFFFYLVVTVIHPVHYGVPCWLCQVSTYLSAQIGTLNTNRFQFFSRTQCNGRTQETCKVFAPYPLKGTNSITPQKSVALTLQKVLRRCYESLRKVCTCSWVSKLHDMWIIVDVSCTVHTSSKYLFFLEQ